MEAAPGPRWLFAFPTRLAGGWQEGRLLFRRYQSQLLRLWPMNPNCLGLVGLSKCESTLVER